MLSIREHRERAGMTQVELAEAAGVSDRMVKRIESDANYKPSVVAADRIASALGVTVDELLHGKNCNGTSQSATQNANDRPTAENGSGAVATSGG